MSIWESRKCLEDKYQVHIGYINCNIPKTPRPMTKLSRTPHRKDLKNASKSSHC